MEQYRLSVQLLQGLSNQSVKAWNNHLCPEVVTCKRSRNRLRIYVRIYDFVFILSFTHNKMRKSSFR